MAYGMYEIISKKRDCQSLNREELNFVIDGYVNNDIPDYQVASLLMAIYLNGLTREELVDLTTIMKNSGDTISLGNISGMKIDKHSTGGVGDKISFIIAPLVAAYGVKVPMLSGRALGHTGGTLDKLESIPGMNVFLTEDQFVQGLNDTGMVICGQTANITPADRKLYALRDTTATVSSIPLISSSIMSKKLALETDGIVLDIKTGSGAFITEYERSKELCRTMVEIGKGAGRRCIGVITNMDQPLGKAVGNSLEMIESIETLKGNGPEDILDVSYAIGAAMLVAADRFSDHEEAKKALESTLNSGKPLDVFEHFIRFQGGDPKVIDDYSLFGTTDYRHQVKAEADGFIEKINAFEVGMAAIDIGAGRRKKEDDVDHTAGFIFEKNVGDSVKRGETILEIHTNKKDRIESAEKRLKSAISTSKKRVAKPKMILDIID